MSLEKSDLERVKSIIESLLIVAAESISISEIEETLKEGWTISHKEISRLIDDLKNEYFLQRRGYQIAEVAGKFQLCTDPQNAEWVKKFLRIKNSEGLSKPALETLAIIAYKQPITKLEIEGIRGVNIDGVLKKLMEKGLIRTRGRKEVLGHPFLYVTTEKFLEYFGLRNINDLPQKGELNPKLERIHREPAEITSENRSN